VNPITVAGLTRRFGSFTAVDNLSFEVRPGEIFGFLGANGAGKSTTIRMLCGLLKPTSGTAMVGGIDVGRDPEGVKRRIGYMSQRFSLYRDLTVDQNIRFFAGVYGIRGARLEARRQFVLEMAGLGGREQTRAADLAGGWRQRLALGCAILHEPPIVFLDEPTGGVDPLSRRMFWTLIDSLSAAGTTVLVTTHYLDEAEHCHRIAIIDAGRLAALGTTDELKSIFAARPIVEVRSDRPVDVMRLLEGMAQVEKTSIFGTAVHAVLTSNDARAPEVVRRGLAEAGMPNASIEVVTPTLEDVFLEVAGERR
jgi:ABC-2 type transport system ATP-binding protein